MGRIHLGQSKSFNSKEIIRFKDWKKKEGSYLIIAIFAPKKYPDGDCDKLRKRFNETFTDFENIKRVYGQ